MPPLSSGEPALASSSLPLTPTSSAQHGRYRVRHVSPSALALSAVGVRVQGGRGLLLHFLFALIIAVKLSSILPESPCPTHPRSFVESPQSR